MRIWLAPSAFAPSLGGIEELTARLGQELVRRGHAVTVVTNRWPQDLPEREVIAGLPVARFDMVAPGLHPARLGGYRKGARRLQVQLAALATELPPDLVHAVGASWQSHHLGAFAQSHEIPFVLTLQGETAMDDQDAFNRGARSLLIRGALRQTVRRARVVTACSSWALDHAALIAPAVARGVVIPNGVEIDEFRDTGDAPAGGPVLAYGRLVRNKGFDLLVNALAGVDQVLEIGGTGPAESSLAEQASRAGARVRMLGRLDRAAVVAALSRCRVVVMPSRLEPFGIVGLEGMAAGRPVVASSIGGAAEFLKGGILVDPFDPHALRSAIDDALAHPELGAAGRQAAAAYDWREITDRYLATYAS